MPVALGRRYVQAPPYTSLPYGLLSVAVPVPDSDRHWRAGVEYQPAPCEAGTAIQEPCPSDVSVVKEPTTTGLRTVGVEPFTVYSWIDCSTVGFADEAEQILTAAFTNGEARAVENAFWTGGVGAAINPHLAEDAAIIEGGIEIQSAAEIVSGGPVHLVEGIGLLEGALADCYGGVGVIHVPRRALTHLVSAGVAHRDGQRYRTAGDTLVAAGAGYPGTGPAGQAPAGNTVWLYATGSVSYRRSEIRLSSDLPAAVDRRVNSVVMVAERTYVIGWDCCHFAVQVQLTGEVGSGGG